MRNGRIFHRRCQGGFTLIELVMGMLISGLILLAVATLSFAMGRGQEVTDLMMNNQAMIRAASVRIPELVHNGLAVWMANDGDLVIWTGDANDNRQIEASELAYLMINSSSKRIELMTCAGLDTPVTASQIVSGSAETTIKASSFEVIIPLLKNCTNMQFLMQGYKYVIVQFTLPAETGNRDYQICARVRADISDWMGTL
jgi:prepilin-type N-terminal cleavage/methylation domain-containing protein